MAEYPNCVLDVDAEAPELRALASYYADSGGALWVAGDIDGMIATRPLGDGNWEICRVYVQPRLHGSGLANNLLEIAERHAIAAGAQRLLLWTDTRFHRAHRFYERQSYVRDGAIRVLFDDVLEYPYSKPVGGVRRLDVAGARSAERRLADVLVACVDAGASVSFLPPLAPARACSFWQGVTSRVGEGQAVLFAGWADGALAGTVQVALDTPENGRHRASIHKLLVHPGARRRGLATALMNAAEAACAAAGRSLLELDTRAGDPAEAFYRAAGWHEVGRIDGYMRDAEGRAHATVILSKRLQAG